MPNPKRTTPPSPSVVDGTGRVYLPAVVRAALGIGKEGGHVAFEVKGGTVTVRAVEWHPK
jgi:bifunctional DNA-binding transcriptional regulator/antitoxin component of YhaV-PrlF toxin-antitoxin module